MHGYARIHCPQHQSLNTVIGAVRSSQVYDLSCHQGWSHFSDQGDWSIDATELHRVFPPATVKDASAPVTDAYDASRQDDVAGLRELTNVLKAAVG